jgi:protein involved in sex pheromone biosynthesis
MSKAQPYKDFGKMSSNFFSNFTTVVNKAKERKKKLKEAQEKNK